MPSSEDFLTKIVGGERPQLTKPKFSMPPAFEQSEWGGRFPQCPYFPMYLGNGRDAMLINIGGSGDGHWEYTPYSSGVINKLHSIGWYKADRRVKRADLGVYGPLSCLLEFTARPLVDGEVLAPRHLRQYFDPRTATLTTIYEQMDNRTGQWTRLLIRTWLQCEGILVQDIDVVSAPDCGIRYSFCINTPSYGYQNTTAPTVQPEEYSFVEADAGSQVRGSLSWAGNRAVCVSLVDGTEVEEVRRRIIPEQKLEMIEQRTAVMFAGKKLRRFLIVKDSWEDGTDPDAAITDILGRISAGEGEQIRTGHLEEWEAFFATSDVRIPDPAVQFQFDLSRYLLKANHHERGFQPVGLLPFQWQGAMFWDAALSAEAFLACGNIREAADILGHIKSFAPQARQLAGKFGNSGARIEWTLNLRDFSAYGEPGRQLHNNAVWALAICQLLEAEPDREDASEYLQFCEELLRFLCDELLRNYCSGNVGASMVGIDESVETPKSSDTWTIAVFLAALRRFKLHCRDRQEQHELAELEQVAEILETLLAANIDDEGVMQSFSGGKVPHWGSLIFDLFPDHPAAKTTLAEMSRNYDTEADVFNFRGISRGAEKGFPWADFWFSRCLARTNQESAFDYFLHATRLCTYFGGFPERLFYHGEHHIQWFSTAHAALIWALQGMIAHVSDGALHLLPGIDLNRWPNLEVGRLYVGRGLELSVVVRESKIVKLEICNRNSRTILLNLCCRHWPAPRKLELESGGNEIV